MRSLAIVFLLISSLFPAAAQNQAPPSNWALSRPSVAPNAIYQNGFLVKPTPTQMCFSFTFSQSERQTSAAIFNTAGKLIRTLWTDRGYAAGTYGECWNGLDDYGVQAPQTGNYAPRVAYNNISYNWDGIIGNTENSWAGPLNQDSMISGFITAPPVFQNGLMYAVTGYTETHFNTPIYDELNPNGPVQQFLPLLGNIAMTQSVSDGHRIYILMQPYNTAQHGGVVAFGMNGQPWNLAGTYTTAGSDIGTASLRVFELLGAQAGPTNPYPGLNILDVSKLNTGGTGSTAVTGLAVQQDGVGAGACAPDGCLATAHGYYDVFHGYGTASVIVPSLNTISLWDKITGVAISSFSIPNPQQMVFDQAGNLWVVSGYHGGAVTTPNVLYEVTGIGSGSPTVTQIGSSTFKDPVSIAISPTTGHLFIADGGTNQQIFEVSTSAPTTILSTIGAIGGYCPAGVCNANIDPAGHNSPTFWFDPDVGAMPIQQNTPFVNWIQISDTGDLWVGDFFAQRILHYTWSGSAWTYVNRIAQTFANVTMTINDPTRLFAGRGGFTEYCINPNVPLQPGDPEAPGGNGSWDICRNWWPVIENVLGYPSSQYEIHAGSLLSTNGNPISFVFSSNGTGMAEAAFQFSKSGVFTYKSGSYPPSGYPDTAGNSYSASSSGTAPNLAYTINKRAISSWDANGFPAWGSPAAIGTYTANASLPQATQEFGTFAPTSDNVIPIYQIAYAAPVGTAPVFHLGGLPVGGSSLQWASEKQVIQPWMNGDGTFPGINLSGVGVGGTSVITLNQDIFAFFAGNNGPVGSNWMHYRSDGMALGQFGWQTSPAYLNAINTYTNIGYPLSGITYPYVGVPPGLEGDAGIPYYVQIGSGPTVEYQIYMPDQAIRAGTQRWTISGLSSVHEASASGPLGSTLSLAQVF